MEASLISLGLIDLEILIAYIGLPVYLYWLQNAKNLDVRTYRIAILSRLCLTVTEIAMFKFKIDHLIMYGPYM